MIGHRIEQKCEELVKKVGQIAMSRAIRASNELRNASQIVLRGQRHGRKYPVPYTGGTPRITKKGKIRKRKPRYYTASAPGEPPANRTGIYRLSWKPRPYAIKVGDNYEVYASIGSDIKVKSGHFLGEILEYGTKDGRIAPRPHKQRIIDMAKPKIRQIYRQPYLK